MKKITFLFLAVVLCLTASSQTAQEWISTLNNLGSSTVTPSKIGTSSNHPLNFYTANSLHMTISTDGTVTINSLAGSGLRFVQSSEGKLVNWFGTAGTNSVLSSNGGWVFNPINVTSTTLFSTPSGAKFGIGTASPAVELDVAGNISSSGIVRTGSLISTGSITTGGISSSSLISAPTLSASGLITAGQLNISSIASNSVIGRFAQVDGSGNIYKWSGNMMDGSKILYSDGNFKVNPVVFDGTSISTSTANKVGIGTSSPTVALHVIGNVTSSGSVTATRYMFDGSHGFSYDGATNSFGFGDNSTPQVAVYNPCNAISSTSTSTVSWLSGNSLGFVSAQATQSTALFMYTSPNNTNGYIEMSGDANSGLYLNHACGKNTYINTGVNGGNAYMGDFVNMNKHLEIGSPLAPISTPSTNVALDINTNVGKGLQLTTRSNSISLFSINDNSGSTEVSAFEILGDGSTRISTDNPDAFRIGTSDYATNFEVYNDGHAEIRTTTTTALAVFNGTNQTLSFDKDGYVSIKVYNPTGMPTGDGTASRVLSIKDMTATQKDIFAVRTDGKVYAREVEISYIQYFPDYVFKKDYRLKSIPELADFISENKHLPGFEKGEYYEKNGINVNNMFVKQQEKIEELTLYIIQLEKRLKALEKTN